MDVVVVGGGLAGMAVATSLARAGLEVTVLDAGLNGPTMPGVHISSDPRLVFGSDVRARLVRALLHPVHVETSNCTSSQGTELSFGVGLGGMGILWNGICERLDTPTGEASDFLKRGVDSHYGRAEAMLGVKDSAQPLTGTLRQTWTTARPLRIAAQRRGASIRVTGPSDLLESSPGAGVTMRSGRVGLRLRHAAGRVRAVEAVNIQTGLLEHYGAEAVVVACDAVRSPALLAASGIGAEPGFPVGEWLTDHPLAISRIVANTPLGLELAHHLDAREGSTGCSGVLFANGPRGAFRIVVRLPAEGVEFPRLALYWYAVGRPHPANKLQFSKDDISPFASIGIKGVFTVPIAEEAALRELVDDLTAVSSSLGYCQRGWKPRLLPLGAAMHTFGTLRTALSPKEAGVTDIEGRVIGFSNLFVAGACRFPGPSAASPVLASVAAALATARAITTSPLVA